MADFVGRLELRAFVEEFVLEYLRALALFFEQ